MNKLIVGSPIRDQVFDRLQKFASQVRIVHLRYKREESEVKEVYGIIKNLYIIKKEKYVLLSGGEEIEVKSIVSVSV